jgi:predicted protein tyrosine phosphatase
MKILVYSRIDFNKYMIFNGITDNNVELKDAMFISINNIDQESYFNKEHDNVKIMCFGDYGEEILKTKINRSENPIFDEQMAKELYEFIKKNKDKKFAILHCGAGISRSGAIGTFLYELYGDGNYSEFKRKNKRIQPNIHMLKLLRKVYEQDKK